MRKLAIYVVFLIAGFTAFISHEWGTVAHSVAGIAIGGVVAFHVSRQLPWIRSVRRRRRQHPESGLAVFNTAFAAVFAVCFVTGFPLWSDDVAGTVTQVHNATAVAFLFMIFGHVFLNRRRIRSWLRGARRPGAA